MDGGRGDHSGSATSPGWAPRSGSCSRWGSATSGSGQPATTLSGGEAQRLKIARELAQAGKREGRKLYILDEPTTGLHLDDVRVLIQVLDRLVDAGHTVVVIEHHMDVVKRADWIVDLGPEAGDAGGRVVVQGTPEQVAAADDSHTGRYLRPLLHAMPEPALAG